MGTAPLSYQWFFNGQAIAGATKLPFERGIAHYDAPPPDVIDDLEEQGATFNGKVQVGMMVEVPSAALMADESRRLLIAMDEDDNSVGQLRLDRKGSTALLSFSISPALYTTASSFLRLRITRWAAMRSSMSLGVNAATSRTVKAGHEHPRLAGAAQRTYPIRVRSG